jgi:hypothetical protein
MPRTAILLLDQKSHDPTAVADIVPGTGQEEVLAAVRIYEKDREIKRWHEWDTEVCDDNSVPT